MSFKIIPIIILSWFVGILFSQNALLGTIACIALPYLFVVYKSPLINLYVFILTSVSFFGYFNPEFFLHLPGFFKLIDVLFCIFIALYIIRKYQAKYIERLRPRNGISKVAKRLLWLLIGFTVFQIGLASIKYNVPMIDSFKIGRHYLYFFIGIFAIDFFYDKKSSIKIIKFLFVIAIIQSLLVILQNIFGGIAFLGYTKIIDQVIGEDVVRRIYMPAYFYVMAVFTVSFWMAFLRTNIFSKKYLIFIITITGIAILLSYTRTLWVTAIVSIIFPMALMQKKVFFRYTILLLSIVLFMGVVFTFFAGKKTDIIKTRTVSILDNVIHYKGTFAVRFEENRKRLELIKQNIILGGPGFVHPYQAPDVFGFRTLGKLKHSTKVQTNDSGILTWLLAFGVVGVVWVLFLLWWMAKLAKKALHLHEEAGLIVGIASYVVSAWLTSLTTTGFTFSRGVIFLSIALYIFSFFTGELQFERLKQ